MEKNENLKIMIETVKISEVKPNPNNPRLIKDDKFKQLVKSIKDFPEMLKLRPIVVNDNMIVLGGNMRLKACKEAGLKEVPIIKASNLSEQQQKKFIIKDNVGFGEHDWEILRADWDLEELTEWGLDVPEFDTDEEKCKIEEKEILPFIKTHILFSFSPELFTDIKDLIQQIKDVKGVDYEQASN